MKTSLSGNTQDTNTFSNTEINKHTMNYSFSLTERKTTIYLRFMKLLLAFFLIFSPLLTNAQTYNLITGAGGTTAGTIWNRTATGTNSSGCDGKTINLGPAGGTGTGSYTANFTGGTPVHLIAVALDGIDLQTTLYDEVEISINGSILTLSPHNFTCQGTGCINNALFSPVCSGVSIYNLQIVNNRIQGATVISGNAAKGVYRIYSAVPITSISIKNYTNNSSGGTAVGLYLPTGTCTVVPVLSATTVSNVCPSPTVNLNSLVTSTAPSGSTLVWYTDIAHTTVYSTPTTASSGTYYAFYDNTASNCYSPGIPVTVVTNICCAANTSPNLNN
jgi:hypothetical protein